MKKALLALLLLIAVAAGILYAFPSTLLATAQYVESARARLSTNSLQVDNLDIAYYEGGPEKAQTILLIHGFGADKSNWPRFARFLTQDYHVIAVDLPGFGDSSKPANISYDVGTQAERLADFMREQGIRPFHVVELHGRAHRRAAGRPTSAGGAVGRAVRQRWCDGAAPE